MDSYYSEDELSMLGFKSFGQNVRISRKASIYGKENISIGDNVRIDDFCFLSGQITIGSYVHLSTGAYLYGGHTGIVVEDFVNISSRSCVYAESDDYSGESLAGALIPDEFKNVIREKVVFQKHALVGSGCTILPGVIVGEGASVGSMSLINKSLDPWGVYVGIPCKKMKDRKKRLLDFEKSLLQK